MSYSSELDKERAKWTKVEAARWAEVDAMAERVEELAKPTKLTDETFGASVPWDGVDPGPGWF
ncbi:hypothetical protein GS536_21175 [Rhodococcus hoagii]|nr:hypothetical protein [Prescottella equi]